MLRRIMLPGMAALLCAAAVWAMGRKQADETPAPPPATVTQGVTGKVEIWEGNFMPMVEPSRGGGTITPGAGLRVRLHEPVTMGGGLASARRDSVATKLVAEAVTDNLGRFAMSAAPGLYSIFVEQDGAWYYNGWNGDGVQGAVTVPPDSVADVLIKVTTKATF